MPPRPRPGDIFEIPLTDGRMAYGQYVLKHHMWGYLVRILPGVFDVRPTDPEALAGGPEQFMAFYPLGSAATREAVSIVARPQLSDRLKAFPLFKAAGAMDPQTGRVKSWWLWDGQREWQVPQLAEEHYNLPLREVIGHGVLVDRILQGWTPADEVRPPTEPPVGKPST